MFSSLLLSASCLGQICYAPPARLQVQSYVQPVQTYVQPVQSYAYAVPYVEKIQFVAVEPASYSATLVGGQLRAETRLSERQQFLANSIDRLTTALDRLERGLPAAPQTPVQPPAPFPPAPPQPNFPPPTPGLPNPTGFATPPPDPVAAIFSAKCATCHTGTAAQGAFKLFETNGNFSTLTGKDLIGIDTVLYAGQMPPKEPLADHEYAAIRTWIAANSDLILLSIRQ